MHESMPIKVYGEGKGSMQMRQIALWVTGGLLSIIGLLLGTVAYLSGRDPFVHAAVLRYWSYQHQLVSGSTNISAHIPVLSLPHTALHIAPLQPTVQYSALTATSAVSGPAVTATAAKKTTLIRYTGAVQHIFFHPLLAYPQLAFHDGSEARGFNDWFITDGEFTRILAALYKRHFILISLSMMYRLYTVHGHTSIEPRALYLPKGKKPLIISVDDMNYYHYMVGHGTVSRLILDAQGHIASLAINPQGKTVLSHTQALVPILNAFVRSHPDFSFHGVKGMINLTGYEGVLGYRTNRLQSPDYKQTRVRAMRVIDHLLATGWTFASHGWGHLDAHAISYATFTEDTLRWEREVGSLIGPTSVYVYPFGSRVTTGGAKFRFLVSQGFHIFCSVGPTTYIQWTPQVLMMDRRHIDGLALATEQQDLVDLFNPWHVISKQRPKTY